MSVRNRRRHTNPDDSDSSISINSDVSSSEEEHVDRARELNKSEDECEIESSDDSEDDVNSDLEDVMIKQYVLPLTMALRESKPIEVISPLIESVRSLQQRTGGAYLDASPKFEHAPLLIACSMGNTQAFVLLLQSGADIHRTTKLGENALSMAVQADNADITRALLRAGLSPVGQHDDDESILVKAIQHNSSSDTVACLLEHQQCPLHNALHAACLFKNLPAAKMLLQRGVDVNAINPHDHQTPLMAACVHENPSLELVTALLQRGARVDAVDCANNNVLHLLAPHSLLSDKNKQITRLLIDAGAATDVKNHNNQTAAELIRQLNAQMTASR